MIIKNIDDQLIYVPNRENGTSTFDGNPIILDELEEILGSEVIDHVRNKLSSIVEFRKEIFGSSKLDYYGLHPVQRFFDLKSRTMILVRDAIHVDQDVDSSFLHKDKYDFVMQKEYAGKSLETTSNIRAKKFIESGDSYDDPSYLSI